MSKARGGVPRKSLKGIRKKDSAIVPSWLNRFRQVACAPQRTWPRGLNCIYGLVDPRTDEIRYVGRSNDPYGRLYFHFYDFDKPTHKGRWLATLYRDGMCATLRILQVVGESQDVRQEEIKMIAHLREEGCRLTNATSGGDGLIDPTPDVVRKIKEALKKTWADPELRKRHGATIKKSHARPEVRQKFREQPKQTYTAERRHQHSVAMKETCARKREAGHVRRRNKHKPETRARISVAIALWHAARKTARGQEA